MLRRNNDAAIPGTLAVLPLPARIVILPGSSVVGHIIIAAFKGMQQLLMMLSTA
jgi:hypothetical protein